MKFLLVALAFAAAITYRRQHGSRWQCDTKPVGVDPKSENTEDRLKGLGPNLAESLGAPVPQNAFAVPEQRVTGEAPHGDSPAA